MLNFLEMFPVQASTHAAEVDQMTVLVHWLMLVLFVGWGAVLPVRAVPVPQEREPDGELRRRQGQDSRRATEVAVALIEVFLLVFYAIPAWAKRVKAFPAESEATVVRVVGEQFAWNVHYPGPDGKFGRTDVKLVSADNPLGLDRTDPEREGRHHDDQPAESAGRPAGAGAPFEQGRHPQLRPVRDAREAGRDSRDEHPGVVHPEPHRRVRDHLLAAVRPRPLPDARVRHHPERGRLPEVVRRSGEGTAAARRPNRSRVEA